MNLKELGKYQEALKYEKYFSGRSKIELRKLNRFIAACPDPLVRSILIKHYVKGFSWLETAIKIGGGITEDNCRMLVVRYLDSKKSK